MGWENVSGLENVDSPGLMIDPEVIQRNIEQMISMVGGRQAIERLRPHAKTHKMPGVAKMQVDAGIEKFKAATLSEVKMLAEAGARDVLLAHQPVGPKIDRLKHLVDTHSAVSFACIVDNAATAERIASSLGASGQPFRVFIDVDCGMHRTGIPFGDGLHALSEFLDSAAELHFCGLHVYDGHIHDESLEDRTSKVRAIIRDIHESNLIRNGKTVIGGGSPTFAIWAAETDWECSPGTTLLWDHGYGNAFPDLAFDVAAALIARVISKPGESRLCLDLGHKAVAAEMILANRVQFPSLPDATLVSQSEEHLVVETSRAHELNVGDVVIGIPRHICPTVALHRNASIVRHGAASGETWEITARDR